MWIALPLYWWCWWWQHWCYCSFSSSTAWSSDHPIASQLIFSSAMYLLFVLMCFLAFVWIVYIIFSHVMGLRDPQDTHYPTNGSPSHTRNSYRVDKKLGQAFLSVFQVLFIVAFARLVAVLYTLMFISADAKAVRILPISALYVGFAFCLVGPIISTLQMLCCCLWPQTFSVPPLCCFSKLVDVWPLDKTFLWQSLLK